MQRQVIQIDQDKCDGCGLCVNACHEGALGLVDGKATLLRDDFCDGMGDCLPSCPQDAISFVWREATPYNEAAVIAAQMAKAKMDSHANMPADFACPSTQAKSLQTKPAPNADELGNLISGKRESLAPSSQLGQWPCQIKLVPPTAPYFQGCDLLIAADCCAFAYGDFHRRFMAGKITLIGCPKLDGVDYSEKLSMILGCNDIKSIEVLRMQVPCCAGIDAATRNAILKSGKDIPCSTTIISTDGHIVE